MQVPCQVFLGDSLQTIKKNTNITCEGKMKSGNKILLLLSPFPYLNLKFPLLVAPIGNESIFHHISFPKLVFLGHLPSFNLSKFVAWRSVLMTKLNYNRKPISDYRFPNKKKTISYKQSKILREIRLKQTDHSYKLNEWERKFLLSIKQQEKRYING